MMTICSYALRENMQTRSIHKNLSASLFRRCINGDSESLFGFMASNDFGTHILSVVANGERVRTVPRINLPIACKECLKSGPQNLQPNEALKIWRTKKDSHALFPLIVHEIRSHEMGIAQFTTSVFSLTKFMPRQCLSTARGLQAISFLRGAGKIQVVATVVTVLMVKFWWDLE